MCGKKAARSGIPAEGGRADAKDDGFPETQVHVLAEAAEDNWEPFLSRYLRPCWREVVLTCRARGVSLSDTEDVFQQVMLRLIQRGGFRTEMRQWMADHGESPDFAANLPGRYLKFRELRLDGARFRTYLQGVIRNLVCEAIRATARRPKQLTQEQWHAVEPFVEESISRSLQQSWLRQCLEDAAWQLYHTSSRARTRGRRRLFRILCLSTVAGRSAQDMATEIGVDRTTVAGLLSEARGRFAACLGEITGMDDPEELRNLLAMEPAQLPAALARVYDLSHSSERLD